MAINVLLDTNILIEREDNHIISDSIQELLSILHTEKYNVFIHPDSFIDINKDTNKKRKEIILNKLKSYQKLKNPPIYKNDLDFCKKVKTSKINDYVDNNLLYALYRNEIDFLITNDLGIHKKSKKFNLEEQVFNIGQALDSFRTKFPNMSRSIEQTTVNHLNISDPIFDGLKEEYPEFNDWFKEIQRQKRPCLIYTEKGCLGAVLIYKEETQTLKLEDKTFPPKNRMKIATLKVTSVGNKIGEHLLSWIINYSINQGLEEIYLTHFVKEEDSLVYLIEEYGFENVGKSNGENYFIKKINKGEAHSEIENSNLSFVEISKKYYPYFCDNDKVNKYFVPIRPEFHDLLFLKEDTQTTLENHFPDGFNEYPKSFIPSNTIKKAYLSHSSIKQLKEGDLLLFYESDGKGINNIGVVESVKRVDNINDLNKMISKRSVYSQKNLEKIIQNEVLAILFIHSKNFNSKISLNELRRLEILKKPPQSIQHLSHEKYLLLKNSFKNNEKYNISN